MPRDRIYRTKKHPLAPFTFDAAVADVFDDMVQRSVPMYAEIIHRQACMIRQAYRPGTRIYDLGCSTGNLIMALCDGFPTDGFSLVAVDSSRPMLDRLAGRLSKHPRQDDISLVCEDLRQVEMRGASVVVVNFTLQFIPPADRDRLIHRIHDALEPGGWLLLSEKTVHPDPAMADLQVDFYHRFKRENGYSALEISQKREALENVLVPETPDAHLDRLRRCGFSAVDVWLKWFNFCAWVCVK